MTATIYTPAEVAEILKVSEGDVLTLVGTGELQAFRVLGEPRITERDLENLISKPYKATKPRTNGRQGQRRRNPKLEKIERQLTIDEILKVDPDLRPSSRTRLSSNRKEVIIRLATVEGPQGYFFGFGVEFLQDPRKTFLVLVLADRSARIVIPCGKFEQALEGLSVSKGDKKLYVVVRGGAYYLSGKGIDQPIPLDSYVNAFHLLR